MIKSCLERSIHVHRHHLALHEDSLYMDEWGLHAIMVRVSLPCFCLSTYNMMGNDK